MTSQPPASGSRKLRFNSFGSNLDRYDDVLTGSECSSLKRSAGASARHPSVEFHQNRPEANRPTNWARCPVYPRDRHRQPGIAAYEIANKQCSVRKETKGIEHQRMPWGCSFLATHPEKINLKLSHPAAPRLSMPKAWHSLIMLGLGMHRFGIIGAGLLSIAGFAGAAAAAA